MSVSVTSVCFPQAKTPTTLPRWRNVCSLSRNQKSLFFGRSGKWGGNFIQMRRRRRQSEMEDRGPQIKWNLLLSFFHPPYVHLLLLFLLQMSVCLCRGGGTFCILESKVVHSESSVFGNSWSLVSQTHYYILVKWRVYINTEGFETNCKKKHWHFSTRIANILSYFSCMQILLSA